MKVLIVEDEYTIALNTQLQLEDGGHSVTGIADNYDEIIEILQEDTPDIILMDINLGSDESGIDIARKLKKIIQVPVIFLSAYSDDQTVQQALKQRPFGYLVKPYKKEDLLIALQVARIKWLEENTTIEEFEKEEEVDYIFFPNGREIIKLYFNEILFLQAMDNYTVIRTEKEKIVVLGYLSAVEEKINHADLVQSHRSYYVNKAKIKSIKSNTIFIEDFEIPIGRSYKQKIINSLQI